MFPQLIQTKYFTINTLWVFFAIGLFAAVYAFIKLSVRNRLKVSFISEHSLGFIFWGLIGARIIAILLNFQTYFYEISIKVFLQLFYFWDKGLNVVGALLGITIFLYYICRKNDQDFWKWLDALVPSALIGLGFGLLGTFFEGTYYGKPTSLPWGVNFESPQIKYTVPIHPTQIYAFLYTIALSVGLISLHKYKNVGLIGIMAYSFLYFLEQFIRGDDTYMLLGIRIPQIIAFIIIISSGILLYLRYNDRSKKHD